MHPWRVFVEFHRTYQKAGCKLLFVDFLIAAREITCKIGQAETVLRSCPVHCDCARFSHADCSFVDSPGVARRGTPPSPTASRPRRLFRQLRTSARSQLCSGVTADQINPLHLHSSLRNRHLITGAVFIYHRFHRR